MARAKAYRDRAVISKSVRFSSAEWAAVAKRCAGRTFSDYARKMILSGVVRVDGRSVALAAFVDVLNLLRDGASRHDLEAALHRYLALLA